MHLTQTRTNFKIHLRIVFRQITDIENMPIHLRRRVPSISRQSIQHGYLVLKEFLIACIRPSRTSAPKADYHPRRKEVDGLQDHLDDQVFSHGHDLVDHMEVDHDLGDHDLGDQNEAGFRPYHREECQSEV